MEAAAVLKPEALKALALPEVEHDYGPADVALYALGIGCGLGDGPACDLPYVDTRAPTVLATFAAVLGRHPDLTRLEFGIDWAAVVHDGEALTLHAPLPAAGSVTGRYRIVDVIDKGTGRGALVRLRREISERGSGALMATVDQTLFCRNDGGFSGQLRPEPPPTASPVSPPDRPPDRIVDLPTVARRR